MSVAVLSLLPFIAMALVATRPLRQPGLHQSVGIVVFAAGCWLAWRLGGRALIVASSARRLPALAGWMFIAPFLLFALLWVGLGPPWFATPEENRLRYVVLLACSVAVAMGSIAFAEVSRANGERLASTLALGFGAMGGMTYLVWSAVMAGAAVTRVRTGAADPTIAALSDPLDLLLFSACVLTYLATGAIAVSMRDLGWLGRNAARGFVCIGVIGVGLILMRGLSFPDPLAGDEPWFMRPGLIAGIPAVAWIAPALLGVLMLREAGRESG